MAAIRIIDGDPQKGNLTMIDSKGNSASTFIVQRRDVVTWQIESAKVSAITQIGPKVDNMNIFSSAPRKLHGNSMNWQGTVAEAPKASEEHYFIDWNDDNGTPHTYDPLIQLNPPFKVS